MPRLTGRELVDIVNAVIRDAEDGLESRWQPGAKREDLAFSAALLQVRDEEQDLVPARGQVGGAGVCRARGRETVLEGKGFLRTGLVLWCHCALC